MILIVAHLWNSCISMGVEWGKKLEAVQSDWTTSSFHKESTTSKNEDPLSCKSFFFIKEAKILNQVHPEY